MSTSANLIFSKFQPQESHHLHQLLCSVFNTSPTELAKLYQDIASTFKQDGWPMHFVPRDFFISTDLGFQQIYQDSPVVAVDLPSSMELDDGQFDKPTIAIIGQDSKNDRSYEHLVIGTPYGLHHRGSREDLSRTKLYFEMIQVLLQLGYRVYLTDIYKVWVCDPERKYNGIRLPYSDRQRFRQLLPSELKNVRPVVIVTWGNVATRAVSKLQLGIQHLDFLHPGGAANGAWQVLLGESPTYARKLVYWRLEIAERLRELPKR